MHDDKTKSRKPRHDEGQQGRYQDCQANDQLAAFMQLVVRAMENGEREQQRKQNQAERTKQRMLNAPFDRSP